jgi:hypothetical protein
MDNFESLRNAIGTGTRTLKEVVTGNGTVENIEVEVKSTEERMKDFIKSLNTIEECIQPYKDQRKDLKKEYIDNGWIEKDQMKLLIKALRLIKDETDMDKLLEVYENLKK